jgi:hypothetical protein
MVLWLTIVRRSSQWLLGGRIGGGVSEEPNTMVDPPGTQEPHAVLFANPVQNAIRRFSINFVIQVVLAHELVKRIVNQ